MFVFGGNNPHSEGYKYSFERLSTDPHKESSRWQSFVIPQTMDLVVTLMAATTSNTLLILGTRTKDGLMSGYGYIIDVDKQQLKSATEACNTGPICYGNKNQHSVDRQGDVYAVM